MLLQGFGQCISLDNVLLRDGQYINMISMSYCSAGVSNLNTQWAKIKKSVIVEGRTGSMFIAKLIEMNLLHILHLELTKLKGGVGHFGETRSRSLEFENTQPEKICHFLTEPLLQHTRTRT